ncbi:MAG: DPP IV N-terminal domain-containing protein, partial [Abditibacteriales bacterium]|nr:DPP IV N-terminal domain-containing protein [Abditibacteriales bacterium]
MRKLLLGVIGLIVLIIPLTAQEEASRPIRFARQPSLSPDGKMLAFSYQGDIWTVAAEGGTATRLTIHEAHDQLPAWSPDGKWVAFSSRREGNYDVWLIPATGGKARQLTFHSADDLVSGWSPDGKQVLFTSARETTRYPSIYTVNVVTGATRLVATDEAALANAAFSPDGEFIACTRGGSWTRKGYRGSANANLMLFPAAGGAGKWLTKDPENERWALFTPDGKEVYFVSDKGGVANLWRKSVDGKRATPVTRFDDGNLFYPTMSRNGERIVFEHNFSLWSLSPPGGEPTELRIFAPSDDRTNTLRRETFTSGAQEVALSPDGKQLAFVVHGEVFVQPLSGGEATRLTDTPQREQDIAWSPDGKLLAFVSDRSGNRDLFTVDVKTKQTTQLTQTPDIAERAPQFSPDGKTIAFLQGWNGTALGVIPAEGGAVRVLVHDPAIGGVAWSPDSRWIAFHRFKSHTAGALADIFVVNVTDGTRTNITRYPVVNTRPVWSKDGKRLFFLSNRTTHTNLWSVTLQEKEEEDDREQRGTTADKGQAASQPIILDFEDIHQRARPITRIESNISNYAVAPDGKTIVFTMSQLGRSDLWRVAAEGGTPTRLTHTGETSSHLEFAPDGAKVIYLSGGSIKSLPLTASAPTTLGFSVRLDIDTRAELL